MSFANYIGPWIWIYLYVVVTTDDSYKALAALKADVNYLSDILLRIWKQNLKVPISEFAELESMSVKVHLFLTWGLSMKYDIP